jgi:type I restriction enzyme S subunit
MSHYNPYPAYKDSGVEWIGRVPEHWEVKRLRHVTSYRNSGVDKKSYDDQQSVKLCNYTDVYYNEFITNALPFMEATASDAEIDQFTLKQGDVLMTKDSEDPADIGIPAFVADDLPGVICGYHLTVIRTGERTLGGYIHRSIQSHPTKAHFFVESPGITRYGLSQDAIGDIVVCLPPAAEQTAIAATLDRETARIDALIAKKTRFIELLKEKRQALITHAVTKGLSGLRHSHESGNPESSATGPKALDSRMRGNDEGGRASGDDSMAVPMKDSGVEWIGEVPEHWDIKRIAYLFREAIRPGNAALPVLSISIHDGITDEEVSQDDRDRRVWLSEDRTKYKRVEPGDIAYNMMRAWQGAFGAVTVPGLVSPAYVVAAPIEPVETAYVEALLRSPMAIEEMRRFSRGIADFRMRLYWDEFRNLAICLPPLHEQRAILSHIAVSSARFDAIMAATERSASLLKERRSALITAAVTGQIDLRDAALPGKDTSA